MDRIGDNTAGIRPPAVERELDELKEDVTDDLGLDDDVKRRGWGGMTTREVGKIGGHMVRRLVRRAERDMAGEDRDQGR
ncbi:MAG: small, acid-soluble spore protein, alpha/beta type [Clostridia bacterium]